MTLRPCLRVRVIAILAPPVEKRQTSLDPTTTITDVITLITGLLGGIIRKSLPCNVYLNLLSDGAGGWLSCCWPARHRR